MTQRYILLYNIFQLTCFVQRGNIITHHCAAGTRERTGGRAEACEVACGLGNDCLGNDQPGRAIKKMGNILLADTKPCIYSDQRHVKYQLSLTQCD